jgi:DNA-binding MarR family transcriptional regulator
MIPAGPENKEIELWHTMRQVQARVCAALARHLQAEYQLPINWYHVLFYLDGEPKGGLRLQALAYAVDVSQSGLTRLLDRMAEAGLVERIPCPADRRGIYAVITGAGRAAVAQAKPLYRRCLEEQFLQYLQLSEIDALRESFTKVLGAQQDVEPCD